MILAEGVALVFALAIAAMYSVLTSQMPRSGGDYVFNSRIVHPAFGFSFNFSLTIWQLFSAAFTLFFIFYVALSPGLQVASFYLGDPHFFTLGVLLGKPIYSFILATIVNLLFTLITLLGIRKVFTTLNVLWGLTIVGTAAMVYSLAKSTSGSFPLNFNKFMLAANGTSTSQNSYLAVIKAASISPIYELSIPAIAICASSVIWVFYETYVSGEIRGASRAKRNFSAMAGAACLNAAIFSVLVYLLYSKVGATFLASVTSLSGGTVLPFPGGSLQALTAVFLLAAGNRYTALLLIATITLGYTILLLPPLYLQPIRSIFAWSFDRVVPSDLSNVSSRFHSPVKATIAVFGIVEAGLVLITLEYASLLGIFFAVIIAPAFSCIFPTSIAAIAQRINSNGRKGDNSEHPNHSRNSSGLAVLGLISLGFILFMTYVFISNEKYFFVTGSFLSPSALIAINFIFIPVGALIYLTSFIYRKSRNKLNLNSIASAIPPE